MVSSLRTFILLLTITPTFAQDPEGLLSIGESQLSSGDYSEAELSFNSALQEDPSFAPALQALSKLHLHKGDLNKANEYSNQAVQADEDFREWANQIGKIIEHVQNGKRNVQQRMYEEAMGEYDAISQAHPYFPDAEFYKGMTRFRQKDIEGAASHFSNAINIYPDHVKAKKGLDNVTKQFLNAGNKAYKRGNLGKQPAIMKKR